MARWGNFDLFPNCFRQVSVTSHPSPSRPNLLAADSLRSWADAVTPRPDHYSSCARSRPCLASFFAPFPLSCVALRRSSSGWTSLFMWTLTEARSSAPIVPMAPIRVPLLARGLLGVFDKSLCEEVVIGLITCGRLVLGSRGPQQEYAGYLSTTSWKLKVSGSRNSRVIGEMMRKERK